MRYKTILILEKKKKKTKEAEKRGKSERGHQWETTSVPRPNFYPILKAHNPLRQHIYSFTTRFFFLFFFCSYLTLYLDHLHTPLAPSLDPSSLPLLPLTHPPTVLLTTNYWHQEIIGGYREHKMIGSETGGGP